MKPRFLLLFNALSLVFLALFAIQLQVGVWYHFFSTAPAPMLWLLPIAYVSLFRSSTESVILIFLMSLAASGFTSKPLAVLCSYHFVILFFIRAFKSRIYWPGYRYFALIALGSATLFQVIDVFASFFIEDYLITPLYLLDRLLRIIMTTLFSLPAFYLLLWLDHSTEKDRLSAPGSHAV